MERNNLNDVKFTDDFSSLEIEDNFYEDSSCDEHPKVERPRKLDCSKNRDIHSIIGLGIFFFILFLPYIINKENPLEYYNRTHNIVENSDKSSKSERKSSESDKKNSKTESNKKNKSNGKQVEKSDKSIIEVKKSGLKEVSNSNKSFKSKYPGVVGVKELYANEHAQKILRVCESDKDTYVLYDGKYVVSLGGKYKGEFNDFDEVVIKSKDSADLNCVVLNIHDSVQRELDDVAFLCIECEILSNDINDNIKSIELAK